MVAGCNLVFRPRPCPLVCLSNLYFLHSQFGSVCFVRFVSWFCITLHVYSVVLFYMVSGYIFYSITIHICLETVEASSLSNHVPGRAEGVCLIIVIIMNES